MSSVHGMFSGIQENWRHKMSACFLLLLLFFGCFGGGGGVGGGVLGVDIRIHSVVP